MISKTLKQIVEAIQTGDTESAVRIARFALQNATTENECEMHVSSDYDLPELILDDAKRIVEDAIKYCKYCGKETALAEFSDPRGKFVNGEQYVFALDHNGLMVAHGGNGNHVGKDFLHVTDLDGRNYIKEIIETAVGQGYGWVEYKRVNPLTGEEQLKAVYFERLNDLIICSGVYENFVS